MRPTTKLRARLLAIILAFAPLPCRAEVTLALNKAFVGKYKDKATISTSIHVDVHPAKPHSISKGGDDGDIHMAGRDSVILLPLVAEIINAVQQPTALKQLKQTAPDQPVAVTGAWRIWFEHLGSAAQIQGRPVPVPDTTNPDHVFEIHPITNFAGGDVLQSFVGIQGYQAYPAGTSFPFYENVPATVRASNTAIMVASGEGKYNYSSFVIELAGKPKDVGDGYLVLARAFDENNLEEAVTARPRRMVFVKGTPPADEVAKLGKGDTLHVLGIPRVNLSEVDAIATKNGGTEVEVSLPYEMIIVAILP